MSGSDELEAARRRTAATVNRIQAEIERRAELAPQFNSGEFESALAEVRRRATVNAHWGIAPSWPVGGRFEVLAKRLMRILLRWYINPLVEQQNAFNTSVLAALYEVEAQLDVITSELTSVTSSNQQDTST